MQCKQCGARLEPEMELCPECGMKIEREEQIVQETEALETESVSSACEEEIVEKTPAKTGRILKMVLAVTAVVVLLCSMVLVIFQDKLIPGHWVSSMEGTVPGNGNASDVTCKGSYTGSYWGLKLKNDTVVAKVGNMTLTNGQLQFLYDAAQYSFYQSYGNSKELNLDTSLPLDRQICSLDTTLTWQQYFLKAALDQWHMYAVLCQQGENNGYKLPQSKQSYLDGLYDQYYKSYVETGEYVSLDAMFQNVVSPGCTFADYQTYSTWNTVAGAYYNQMIADYEVTEDMILACYEEFREELEKSGIKKDDGQYTVSVRHILLTVETVVNKEENISQADWETCKEEAQKILDQWKAGEATPESFAELAKKYSEDPGSYNNGGLYTEVKKGDMVASFDSWCFDEERKAGDTGLVQTEYGYHIMYFEGTEDYWYVYCRQQVPYWKVSEQTESQMDAMAMEIDFEKIRLWEFAYNK